MKKKSKKILDTDSESSQDLCSEGISDDPDSGLSDDSSLSDDISSDEEYNKKKDDFNQKAE